MICLRNLAENIFVNKNNLVIVNEISKKVIVKVTISNRENSNFHRLKSNLYRFKFWPYHFFKYINAHLSKCVLKHRFNFIDIFLKLIICTTRILETRSCVGYDNYNINPKSVVSENYPKFLGEIVKK